MLHLSYRPKDFDEVIGNQDTVNSLKNIMGRGMTRPRSYLLHGPTGCGKTTLGRIISKHVGCPPDIADKVNPDFQEINISNNRGIDTAREIMSGMRFKPMNGKARVYLLDEVHQSTKDFQNAMLKPLEDTPAWVYFILCTTAPEQLIATLRGRCTPYQVSFLGDKEMRSLLDWVLQCEGIEIQKEILDLIIKEAGGIPRQALVTLDQVIDLEEGEREAVIHSIKLAEKAVIDLCRALVKGEGWGSISSILKGIPPGEEAEKIRRAVLGYITTVALNSAKGDCHHIFDAFRDPFYDTGRAGLVFACQEACRKSS